MMFYWLYNFLQCLPPFFHQGVGSKSICCTTFKYFTLSLFGRHVGTFFVKKMTRQCGTIVETGALNIVEGRDLVCG
jgi:hypothetical protein